jgi:chromosomal replication initiation ATPase DnaA
MDEELDIKKLALRLALRRNLRQLLIIVCGLAKVAVEDVISPSRLETLVFPRATFAAIAREQHPKAQFWLIGSIIKRGHSSCYTMVHQVEDVRQKREYCNNIRQLIAEKGH